MTLQQAILNNPGTFRTVLGSAVRKIRARADHTARALHHSGLTLYHVRAGHSLTAYYSARRSAHHAILAREA